MSNWFDDSSRENIDSRELDTVIAFLARFPSVFHKVSRSEG
jgi:hypothetical protein